MSTEVVASYLLSLTLVLALPENFSVSETEIDVS
jgi:hypothetical protein